MMNCQHNREPKITHNDHWGDYSVNAGYYGSHTVPCEKVAWTADAPNRETARRIARQAPRIVKAMERDGVWRLRLRVEFDKGIVKISDYDGGYTMNDVMFVAMGGGHPGPRPVWSATFEEVK